MDGAAGLGMGMGMGIGAGIGAWLQRRRCVRLSAAWTAAWRDGGPIRFGGDGSERAGVFEGWSIFDCGVVVFGVLPREGEGSHRLSGSFSYGALVSLESRNSRRRVFIGLLIACFGYWCPLVTCALFRCWVLDIIIRFCTRVTASEKK